MFEKIFQVLFLLIMTVGILGLPLYYYLNARKKRLMEEYEEDKEPNDDNASEDGVIDNTAEEGEDQR